VISTVSNLKNISQLFNSFFSKNQSDLEENITDTLLIVMGQFAREKLNRMETELKAAKEGTIDILLVQQLGEVRVLIEKSKSLFREVNANDQAIVNDLERKLAEAENWRVENKLKNKIHTAKERKKKREEKHTSDKVALTTRQRDIQRSIDGVRINKNVFIKNLKKSIAACESEIENLNCEMRKREKFRTDISWLFALGSVATAVGTTFAGPIIAAVGAVVAVGSLVTGFLKLAFEK